MGVAVAQATYMVVVPEGVHPGQQMVIDLDDGTPMMVCGGVRGCMGACGVLAWDVAPSL